MTEPLAPRYLEVWLHGQHVGWLCEAGRVTRFVPTEPYQVNPRRATLSFSITVPGQDGLTQETLNNRFDPALYRERGELPPFFAGLLPEGPLRQRLAATRKHPRDRDDFGILASAGEDLPGAVKVRPADLGKLTSTARAVGVTGGADNLEIGVPEAATEGAAAISGVQDKIALSAAHQGRRYCLPVRGQLSDLIAKLPAPRDDAQVRNEHACMQLAALAGVQVAATRLVRMSEMADHPALVEALGAETRFLAVDRFDRVQGRAVHMEDSCQLLTRMPSQKYAGVQEFVKLVRVLTRFSARGIEDVRQFFVRQAVNALLGNSDAHLKNFSVLYPDGVMPVLSPAYDIVCVAALPGFQGFTTNAAIDRLQRRETLDTYADVARMADISPRIVRTAVKQAVQAAAELWPAALAGMEVGDAVKTEILARLDALPLVREALARPRA